MSNALRNTIRTAVPSIVGSVVMMITEGSAHVSPAVLAIAFPLATTAYYALIRFLEEKFPQLSWLLGCLPMKPTAPSVLPK
jgi:hypothetical protein